MSSVKRSLGDLQNASKADIAFDEPIKIIDI